MSDLLTRWLYGNVRHGQDQQGEATPGQESLAQNQATDLDNEAQSADNAQVSENIQTQSSETLQNQPGLDFQTKSEGNFENQSVRCSHTQSDDTMTETESTETVKLQLLETEPVTSTETSACTKSEHTSDNRSDMSNAQSFQNVSNEIYTNLKLEQEFSDSKSEESHSSFVHKIEAMNVDDSDSRSPGTCHGHEHMTVASDAKGGDSVETDSERVLKDIVDAAVLDTEKKDDVAIYNPLEPTSYPVAVASSPVHETRLKCDLVKTMQEQVESNFARLNETYQSELLSETRSKKQKQAYQTEKNNLNVPPLQTERSDDGSSVISDDEPLYMLETGQYRETVSAAVNTLRAQNVKPVVSLHYSSEGTSASTIKVGFTQFQNLEEEIAETNPDLVNQIHNSGDSHVNEMSNADVTTGDGSLNNNGEINVVTGNQSGENIVVKPKSETENKSDSAIESESKRIPKESNNIRIFHLSESGRPEQEAQLGACAMDVDNCDNVSAFKPFSVKTADNEQCLVLSEDLQQSDQKNTVDEGILHEIPSCSYAVEDLAVKGNTAGSKSGMEADKWEVDKTLQDASGPVTITKTEKTERMALDNDISRSSGHGKNLKFTVVSVLNIL